MEWSAQTIREVEFREKLRGYHPDDVDAFVEQVAAAFSQLEAQAADPAPAPPATDVSEDTIRKTLLMAQRTADLVVSEAEESASRLLGDARSEADALVAEASRLADDREAEARQRLQDEIAGLERARAELQHDVDSLHEYVDRQRLRLRELLIEQLQVLDEGRNPLDAPPSVVAPAPVADVVRPAAPGVVAPAEAESDREEARPAAQPDEGAVIEVDLLSRSVHLPGEGEDDPFLAELRRAVDDPAAAGPAEAGPAQGGELRAVVEDFEVRRSRPDPDDATRDETVTDAPVAEGTRLGGRLFRRQ